MTTTDINASTATTTSTTTSAADVAVATDATTANANANTNATKPHPLSASFLELPKDVQQEQLERFKGICALYGYEGFLRLFNAKVVIIGNGGVGSWIAESLCRTGVGELVLVDFDNIELSNSNRQLHTLSSTIGQGKAQTLGARLKDINPHLKLSFLPIMLTKENVALALDKALGLAPHTIENEAAKHTNLSAICTPHTLAKRKLEAMQQHMQQQMPQLQHMQQNSADTPESAIAPNIFVAEAIDDLFVKAMCVDYLHRAQVPLVTSGGAGGRVDPSRVRLGDVSSAQGDQLIKRLRTELRRNYGYPSGAPKGQEPQPFNICCSFSDEVPMTSKDRMAQMAAGEGLSAEDLGLENCPTLPSFGASVTVTATAGLLLASVIIRWIIGAEIK